MDMLKKVMLLATLPLLCGCLGEELSDAVTADDKQVPYTFRLPDGRLISGVGVRTSDAILIDDDVVIPATSSEQERTQSGNATYNLWPSTVIPYTFDPAVDAVTRQKVLSAMAPWAQAGISFQPRTYESSYVWITTAIFPAQPWVCGATIGLQPSNTYYAGSACRTRDFVHEWGHIIGLYHEHCRNDRNAYVYTQQCPVVGTAGYSVGPYDFDSIMHYDAYARNSGGSINFSSILIQPLDGRSLSSFGFNETPSAGDISAVQSMYGVEQMPETRPLQPVGLTTRWDQCYGRHIVSWTRAGNNVQWWDAQKKPFGTTTWTLAYSGAADMFTINVTVATSLRVRACNWVGCSSYAEAPVASYYQLCPVP